MKKLFVIVATMFLLAVMSCGGGGDEASSPPNPPTPTTSAEGLYRGITNTNRYIDGVFLDDGTFYVVYSVVNNHDFIAGVVQGNGTASAGNLSSSNAKDFNIEGLGVYPVIVTAKYVPKQSVDGTVVYNSGNSITFTSTYDKDYEKTPSLSDLAGTFTGWVAFSLGTEDATVTISSTGSVTGVGTSGCVISGSVAPRSSGNVYNVSISFGDDPCYFKNQTMTGIGYYDSDIKRIWAAAPNSDRTEGIMFVGSKP